MPTFSAAVKLSAACAQSTLTANSLLTTAGGGWAVFQKRLDGSVNFYRGWNDYKARFGHLNGEYWLGLAKLNKLTTNNRKRYKL